LKIVFLDEEAKEKLGWLAGLNQLIEKPMFTDSLVLYVEVVTDTWDGVHYVYLWVGEKESGEWYDAEVTEKDLCSRCTTPYEFQQFIVESVWADKLEDKVKEHAVEKAMELVLHKY
jgi:hypothetical protein